ncbi:hypothetical protein EON65_47055 [archaeon]|nr:MAG: hypothetical protein EON65_47055 [archaeon]
MSKDDLLRLCTKLRHRLQKSECRRSEERNKNRLLQSERDRLLKLIEISLGVPLVQSTGHIDLNHIEALYSAMQGKSPPSSSLTATTGEATSSIEEETYPALSPSSSVSSFESPYIPLSRTLLNDTDGTVEDFSDHETEYGVDEYDTGWKKDGYTMARGWDRDHWRVGDDAKGGEGIANVSEVREGVGGVVDVMEFHGGLRQGAEEAEIEKQGSCDEGEDDFEFGLALYS